MEEYETNVVALLKEHPGGIHINKLCEFYNKQYQENLTVSSLGFISVASFVKSLKKFLMVEKKVVYYKGHYFKMKRAEAMDKTAVLKKLVTMVEQYPEGIPIKTLSIVYSQTYHKNLTLSTLGFDSITSLVDSLNEDLIVQDQLVYHKIHQHAKQPESQKSNQAAGGCRSSTPEISKPVVVNKTPATAATESLVGVSHPLIQPGSSLRGTPLLQVPYSPVNLVFTAPKPVQSLSQDQLYQRVLQVMTKYQENVSSVEQLKTFYLREFGETFPLAQYMSVYDKWEANGHKELRSTQSEPPAGASTGAPMTPTAAGNLAKELEKLKQVPLSLTLDDPSEFPELMSKKDEMTKWQKKKLKDEVEKDNAAPVFKDSYHAQLREVHGDNMRAVEAMTRDEDRAAGGRRKNRVVDESTVNSLMEDVRREIAAEGELVTEDKVISRTCELMQVPSLEAFGHRNRQKYQALKDLQYTTREINIFIRSTEAISTICTLYELSQSLAGLKDKKRFEELNLGPLCKIPEIHRMFKINSNTKDDDIQQIETADILKHLRVFRKKSPKVRVDLTEFLQYLTDQYDCESPYELGIRINSVALSISTLTKVRSAEFTILDQARQLILKELEEETQDRLRKVKRSVLESLPGAGFSASSSSSTGNTELRKKFASMTAAEVVLEVFSNAEGVFTPRMTKHVQTFLLQVSGDRLMTALFQLAICGGSLAIPQDLVPRDKTPKTKEQPQAECDKSAAALPSAANLKEFLKDSLSSQHSAINLAFITNLERQLTKHFQVKDFQALQQGSFLEFLVKHIQLLQDSLGSTLFLGSGNANILGNGSGPTKQDVFEFIKQCGDFTSKDPDELFHVESALRSHYRVRDSRDLGYGTLQTLVGLVKRLSGLTGGGPSQVFYESALFAKHSKDSTEVVGEVVGRLGEVSKAQALDSLLSCPLLEDVNEWSQWELVFKPLHGPIKDFIERNAGNTGLAVLEVAPGLLLRITSHTGDKHFHRAVTELDPVGTAGHLVSMVATDGINNVSTALLANYMQSSLESAVAKDSRKFSQAEEETSCYSRVARFVLACLTRIPNRTCQALLQKVFLVPFSRAVGQAVSKQALVSSAQSDPRHMNCLHRLGLLLGITDWVKDYQKKLNPQQRQDPRPFTPLVDQVKTNLVNSASSSLSALNMSEEDYLEENFMDDSSVSSNMNPSQQLGDFNSEQDVEEDEEEQLFELVPVLNGEVSPVINEVEDGEEEEKEKEPSEESDSEQKEDDSMPGCQSETTISPQRAIIEDIRKSEFGIGEELTAKGQKLIEKNQDRLGRSLERLSTELYSKDTHFVLELIQNADDNSYPSDASVVPSLAFVVERDCIAVLNNEIGFQENNIRAVCDVGCSTKGKHKYGYIGQKGIGFKSVFKVTDCPEIHSNGFHIRFDRTSGVSLGYILPHWTEDVRPLEAQIKNVDQNSWTTKICLPLRTESHQTRNLFKDIHPSLLLFLHRLRSITICNQSENRVVTMTRKDLSHNVVEVEHTDGVERWLVVKTTLHPKQLKEEVESTELALAFQLCNDDTGSDIVCQPEKQPVFAYLPLRSFGFRFIVQADFDIPSSREDVDRDSCWNQWLRSELPQLFLQAMDVFTNHPQFCGLKGLSQFLQFIPLPDEVMDFFQRVAGQIITLLKGKAFLPTLSSDDEVVYKMPSQVAVCQDPVIREVINNEELGKHLSLSYLHPGLSPAPPKSLLKDLGVRYLGGSDVTTVTTAMAKELLNVEGIHSEVGLRQLARLLVCNFRALEYGYGESDSILQSLKDLPIIPLADGRVVSLSTEEVFFPMEDTKTKKSDQKTVQTGPLTALYKDVSVVLPSLLNCVEPLESQQVRELLRRLGVHELEPQELLEQHIYPCIRNNKWKFKSEAVVMSYLVFIKQHSTSSQEYSDIAVPVLTTRGLLCPGVDRVYFSEEYGNINLPNKLPGFDWILLSPCYVQTDWDVAGWRELFSRLGVRDGFIIRKERKSLTAEELTSSPWLAESGRWHLRPGQGCVIDDYPCEEFHALVTAQLPGTILLQQRDALLKLLASNWDTGHHYSQYLTAQVIDSDGRPIRSTVSSFSHHLRRLEWVPAYRVLEGDQQERTFLCPNSVYLTSPEVTNLLGSHVFYLDMESSEFTRALGMRQSISVEALINYLKEWCVKPEDANQEWNGLEVAEGTTFTTTVQHIHNVYTYLQTNCSQSSLKELFQHTPAVFIEYNRRETGWCSGRFYHLKEVCWSDTTKMFQRYKPLTNKPDSPLQEPKLLAPFYSPLVDMKDFFIKLLNVDPSPNMKQYVGLLELICSSAPIPTTEVLQDVSLLFARLAQKCKVQVSVDPDSPSHFNLNQGYCSTLKGMVSDKRVFPTKENNWVTLKHKPMIPDNKELEKIFKSDKKVCLLNLPPPTEKKVPPSSRTGNFGERTSVPYFIAKDRLLFMEICGICSLSQCVKSEPQTESLRPCATMQDLVRSVVPYIQRFLYYHEELSQVHSELVDNNINETIRRLQFRQVGKLYIRYQLDVVDSDCPLVEMQDVICLLKDRKELYIQKDHLDARLDICRELVKLFCTESSHRKELIHFLSALITSLNEPTALKRLLLKEDIRELPSDEEQWEVPEPPRPDVHLERISRFYPSTGSVEEPVRPVQEDGDQTLACWPPRAPMHNSGGSRGAAADGGVVEAVMQKWPPPPGPKDRGTEREASAPREEGGHLVQQSTSSSSEGHQALRGLSRPEQTGTQRVLSHPGQPHPPHLPHPPAANLHTSSAALPPGSDPSQLTPTSTTVSPQEGMEVPRAPAGAETSSSAPPAETVSHQQQPGPDSLPVPEAVVLSGTFQGTADSQRPPLNLDFPLWNRVQPPQETLEDMTLDCQRPTTVVLSDDQTDVLAIGGWGEELVYSFLCHWRDSGEPGCPTDVLWCNHIRESGLPYDFKISFAAPDTWTYVEVKSTIKKEKAFIHLSVKELDFALREKERYHVYRVYSAGDANNVRLCRIQNLAQHLYTKELGLYLFV